MNTNRQVQVLDQIKRERAKHKTFSATQLHKDYWKDENTTVGDIVKELSEGKHE